MGSLSCESCLSGAEGSGCSRYYCWRTTARSWRLMRFGKRKLSPDVVALVALSALLLTAAAGGMDPMGDGLEEIDSFHGGGIPGFRPVVVFLGYKRVDSMAQALDSWERVVGYDQFPVFLSVDSGGAPDELEELGRTRSWVLGTWVYNRTLDEELFPDQRNARFYITRHYRNIFLNAFSSSTSHSHVILFEDDLRFAPDTVRYFAATAWLLDADPSLFGVSAFSDNGIARFARDAARMLRTDVLTNLALMMKREIWTNQLEKVWPTTASTGWDHWLRLPEQMRGRSCIVPEVSRIFHAETKGSNIAQREQKRSFADIKLQEDPNVEYGDLTYLLEENYDASIRALADKAMRVRRVADALQWLEIPRPTTKTYLHIYKREQYARQVADKLMIFPNRRGTYKGLTVLRDGQLILLLADGRACPFLRESERILPKREAMTVPADYGEPCTQACKRHSRKCNSAELEFLNNCSALETHFACEGGCGFEIGPDLPAYVNPEAESLVTKGQCLVTDGGDGLNCNGKYALTRRLCACV